MTPSGVILLLKNGNSRSPVTPASEKTFSWRHRQRNAFQKRKKNDASENQMILLASLAFQIALQNSCV